MIIRNGLVEILSDRKGLKMDIQVDAAIAEKQKEQLDLLIDYLHGNRPMPITIRKEREEHSLVGQKLRESLIPPPPSVSEKQGGSK